VRIYLAGPWKHRAQAKADAEKIRAAGHTVTSRWHDQWGANPQADAAEADPVVMAEEAEFDFADVFAADVMIVLNIEKSEGKAVEQGIAHALDMPIYLVGTERFNVFSYRPNVQLVPSLNAALYAIGSPTPA
jgi:nucleoside 2-deoxyribosyltransferase